MGGSLEDQVQGKGGATASAYRRCIIPGIAFRSKGASLHVVVAVVVAVGVP